MKLVTRNDFIKNYLKICQNSFINPEIEKRVRDILDSVRNEGDSALIRFGAQFDHVELTAETLKVKAVEFKEAEKIISKSFLKAIRAMSKNIQRYQKDLLYKDWIKSYPVGKNAKTGGRVRLGALVRPLERVGVYVPGGTAPLVSTVLMTVIPANVAGVREVIVTTPPNTEGKINPHILAACKMTGVKDVYKVGGAQGIGALAYGTQTIPKVDKIVGPGNIYVATAKRQVYGYVGIDMVAGPSEVLIIADDSSNPKFVAADLLAQAEHDVMARTVLVTTSSQLANAAKIEIELQMKSLKRDSTARISMENNGFIVIVNNLNEAVEITNWIAPEHCEILCRNPLKLLSKIKSAGAVFIGSSTPEPVGDYVAGPSHVLPTGGTARFFSPLSARDFLKSISFLQYDLKSLREELPVIQELANIEGLDAHRKSAEARFLKSLRSSKV